MPIPKRDQIEIPLLSLIFSLGGSAKSHEIYKLLAIYFNLSEQDLQEVHPKSKINKWRKRVQWTKTYLSQKYLIENSGRGTWKITQKGINLLEHLGIIEKCDDINNKHLDGDKKMKKININEIKKLIESPKIKKGLSHKETVSSYDENTLSSDDKQLIELVIDDVFPNGVKKFPDDFQESICKNFKEIEVPGTKLFLTPYSDETVVSPGGYFKYKATNPAEAKYIIYASNIGAKKIKIPKDNRILFKTVKKYKKYVSEVLEKCFDLFLEFKEDENEAEFFKNIVKEKLGLKEEKDLYLKK